MLPLEIVQSWYNVIMIKPAIRVVHDGYLLSSGVITVILYHVYDVTVTVQQHYGYGGTQLCDAVMFQTLRKEA